MEIIYAFLYVCIVCGTSFYCGMMFERESLKETHIHQISPTTLKCSCGKYSIENNNE